MRRVCQPQMPRALGRNKMSLSPRLDVAAVVVFDDVAAGVVVTWVQLVL